MFSTISPSGKLGQQFNSRYSPLELHAHLNGSISEQTIQELYEHYNRNNATPINCWDRSIFCKDSCSFNEFFEIFKITYKLTATPETVQVATERVIEDFSKDNVIYLELRSTLRKEASMMKRDYLAAMIKGVLNCRIKYPNISVKLLVSINRSEIIESAEENVKLTIEYFKKYPDIVVGVDLSGNPKNSKFHDYVPILESARKEGLKFSIHCGETPGNEDVKEILNFFPERIGHAIHIHESYGGDSDNWKLLLDRKIPVEICITSNIKCHTVDSLDNHQFKHLYAAGHPISIATDDKGVFGTSLTKEFEIVQKNFNLTEEELWKLSYNSIDYIFADQIEKESLRTILNQWKVGNF